MRKLLEGFLLFSGILITVWACRKSNVPEEVPFQGGENPSSGASGSISSRLSYGDTVFFMSPQSVQSVVMPVSKPGPAGFFKAIPFGLAIDSTTGRINLSESETGLRYKVYYINANDVPLDSVKLVVSGIDYQDAIYEIAKTPAQYDTAFPFYNAKPGSAVPCADEDLDDDGDLDDDDNQCVFDETDLDGDGNDDIAGVIQDKLIVDIKKGTIDVEASFRAGIFGSSEPANGIHKDFTFFYRLHDESQRALNKIAVRIYHYRRKTDIPQALLDTINLRNRVSVAVNSRNALAIYQTEMLQGNMSSSARTAYLELYAYKRKRPPIIIIVSDY